MPWGVSVKNIAGSANIGGNHSASFFCTVPGLQPGASESATLLVNAQPGPTTVQPR
jgi:hypothetical protein